MSPNAETAMSDLVEAGHSIMLGNVDSVIHP